MRGVTVRQRAFLGAVGALSGLVGGLGFSLVVTQSGFAVEWVANLSVAGVVVGLLWGASTPPRSVRRLGAVGAAAVGVLTVAAGIQPAQAQEPGCIGEMHLRFDDGTVADLLGTSRGAPALVPLEDGREFELFATAPGIERGVLRVIVEEDANPLLDLSSDRLLIWHGDIVEGTVETRDRVAARGGIGGFLLESTGLDVPPWGRFETVVTITDLLGDAGRPVCTVSVWMQFTARPFSSPVGRLGGGLVAVGILGFGATDLIRRRMEPGPRPPTARPMRRIGLDPGHVELHFEEVGAEPGGAAPSVPIDPVEPLVRGRHYRLVVTVTPELDVEEIEDRSITAVATSPRLRVRPSATVSVMGAEIRIPLEFTPERPGRGTVAVDLLSDGHLLRTEQITATVVAEGEAPPGTTEQVTRALLAPSGFTAADLSARRARDATIVLESDPADGSINARVYSGAELVCHVDSTNAAASVVDEAFRSRERLGAALRVRAEQGGEPERHTAIDAIRSLAIAGRYLHRALFPPGDVVAGSIDAVTGLVRSGTTVQVNHARSGLGRATLPWAAVYDRPLSDLGPDNVLCDAFPGHPVDSCPHLDDPTVFCPSGFWGYRAIIEQPEAEVHDVLLSPPAPGEAVGSAVGHLLPDLSDSARSRRILADLGPIRWVDDLRDLITALTAGRAPAWVYLYTHDARRDDRPALVVGAGHLTPLTFDGLDLEWPSGPLVFLNACSTGAALPEDALTFIRVFRVAGASCVVTTECEVFDPAAGAVGTALFGEVLAGGSLGSSLLGLRRSLLDVLDPLGLAYGVHGPTDRTVSVLPDGTIAEPV